MTIYNDFYSYIKDDLTTQYTPIDKSKLIYNSNNSYPIDLHVHSKYSSDGYMTVEQIVKRCIENSVEWTSITDHNSFRAITELRQQEKNHAKATYFEYDGVKIFTGVEVSCRMFLSHSNNLKLHVLCYGFDTHYDSILNYMISSKEKDYISARYYSLYYLAKLNPKYQTTLSEFKEFEQTQASKADFTGRINFHDTIEFYKSKGFSSQEIEHDLKLLDFKNPTRDTITLDVVDVINATHASGGYCAIAHPVLNLHRHWSLFHKQLDQISYFKKITDRLLEVGCDGIEIANRDDIISQKFNSLYCKTIIDMICH